MIQTTVGLSRVVFLLLIASMIGCRDRGNEPPRPAETPQQVLRQQRARMASIQTVWEQADGLLGAWETQGRISTGVYVASDGAETLVLVCRRDVDPGYQSRARTRDVVFRVSSADQYQAGQYSFARLVAVYANGQDLALLRVSSPTDRAFALPVARAETLAPAADLAVIAPPAGEDFQAGPATLVDAPAPGESLLQPIHLTLAPGQRVRGGAVFTLGRVQFVGLIRGSLDLPTDPPVATAMPAEALVHEDNWSYLIDETRTRALLGRLRDAQSAP